MEEIRKQTVSRIAEFFNGESTNAEVDTYKKLLDFEKEVKQQFSLQGVTQQSEPLVAFMKYYKNNVPIGTQKSSAEIVKDYLVTNGG